MLAVLGVAMSGGVHRVAQSAWDCPQAGKGTVLSLFFALDNPLPVGGWLIVTVPSGTGLTVTAKTLAELGTVVSSTAYVHAWTLGTSLNPPTTVENQGRCSWVDPKLSCQFAKALAAKTSYGLALPTSGTSVAGAFAPVTMETRMNSGTTAGPVRDRNMVFDSINTDVAAKTFTVAHAQPSTSSTKIYPGDTTEATWTFTMTDWAATDSIKAPYNIVMKLGAAPSRVQATTGLQSATIAWERYAVTYDEWTWVATCTNTQFGPDDADPATPPPVTTLVNKTPACSVVNGALVIAMTEDLTSTDWANFKMIFSISVKLPSNNIKTSTTMDATIVDPASNNLYASAAQVSSLFKVTKPTGQLDSGTSVTQVTGLVSFGKDPNDTTQQGYGVGVYSSVFCITEGTGATTLGHANYKSNCQMGTGNAGIVGANAYTGTATELPIINSIELAWALPYNIPNDRTQADIVCKTNVDGSAFTAGSERWLKDALKIHQSSMIAKGFGTGHCFYLGKHQTSSWMNHRFRCTNMGALSKPTVQLAFQFTISSVDKAFELATSTAKNVVVPVVTAMDCTLTISTWGSASTSDQVWYQSKYTVAVDTVGNSGKWQTFIGVPDSSSAVAEGNPQQDVNLNVIMNLMLSKEDTTNPSSSAAERYWPFRTQMSTNTDKTSTHDLLIRAYCDGQNAFKSDAAIAITIADAAKLGATGSAGTGAVGYVIKAGVVAVFTLPATGNAVKDTSVSATGLQQYKIPAANWGGASSGCAASSPCATTDDTNRCDLGTGTIHLFATNNQNRVCHSMSGATDGAGTRQTRTSVQMTQLLKPTTSYLTTFRGRGGLGSSSQKLFDVFWQMTTAATSSDAIGTLIHYMVTPASANALSDANAKVTYGFPLTVWMATAAGDETNAKNDGSIALSTGMKIFISATEADKPVAEYYGFYTMTMTPFMKSTGANEVEVVVSTSRDVKCYYWGQPNGLGYSLLFNDAVTTNYIKAATSMDKPYQNAGLNMMICKLGTTAGTATTGDVIVIPSTQVMEGAEMSLPVPGEASNILSVPTLFVVAQKASSNGDMSMGMLLGSDEYLGTMTAISDGATALTTLMQPVADTMIGATLDVGAGALKIEKSTVTFNTESVTTTYDINTETSGEWLIGKDKTTSVLTFYNLGLDSDLINPASVAVVCTAQTGSPLPSTLVMKAGAAAAMTTNGACGPTFSYTVGASDDAVTDYGARVKRMCRWCGAKEATGAKIQLVDYVPPVTSTRLIKGISIWSLNVQTGSNAWAKHPVILVDALETTTKQAPTAVGGCGVTGTPKIDTKGQQVSFKLKTANPLAFEQVVFWQDVTSSPLGFQLSPSVTPTGSVKCSCGSRTWNTEITKGTNQLYLTLPAASVFTALGETITDEVMCPTGDVNCEARLWSTTTTVLTSDMDLSCFACEKMSSVSCATTDIASSGNKMVAEYASAQKVTFNQKTAKDSTLATLKVTNFKYEPNSKTALGRFYYKPSTTMKVYTGSTFEYTMGGQTFPTTTLCAVYTSVGGKPSMVHSDAVSDCVVSASKVTITMAKDTSINFQVQLTGIDAWSASTTKQISGKFSSWSTELQTSATDDTTMQLAQVNTTAITATTLSVSNDLTSKTFTLVVARSLKNVMDVGMVELTITPKLNDFGADSFAFVSFPSYYNPTLGDMMRCSLYDATAKADGERLYCKVAWDWTLQVWGPATAQKKAVAFVLRVYGVQMNLFTTAQSFGVGLTNQTYWKTHAQLHEYALKEDVATGAWGGKAPVAVTSIASSSNDLRGSTDLTVAFDLKATTDTVTNDADFVALQLPYQWMGVPAWMDGTAKPSATLSLVTVASGKTTKTAMKGAVSHVSGSNVVFELDTTVATNKLAEGKSYEFVLSGVPTCESGAMGARMHLGSMVLSVGKVASGGTGYSSAQLFPALKAQAAATGKALLEFSSSSVSISRGTYTSKAVCVKPASGNFASDVAVKVTGAAFKLNPENLSAKMGDAQVCGDLGTASTTQLSDHFVRWSVVNGTSKYTNLPTMTATVGEAPGTVSVSSDVTCSLGGLSVPIVVTADKIPFTDIKVSLKTDVVTANGKTTDNSAGITPNAGEVVTLKVGTSSGILGFQCATAVTGTSLLYVLDGTDKANFGLSVASIKVKAEKAGTKPTNPAMTLAGVADKSKAASTVVEGECPGMGDSWINLQPRSWGSKPLASVADVKAAALKFVKGAEGNYKADQWYNQAVTKAGEKTTGTFETASKAEYSAMLYCSTIEGWFFASTKAVNVTAADNGGKPVTLTLTYKKAIDDVAQNSLVLQIAGKLAETMAVPYSRVTDAYGGYFGAPSATLPATSASATAAKTNTTANKTMRMLNTTNATVNKTEWTINMFVAPDPFAEKADNDATVKAVTGTAALAEVEKLTKATYGAATAAAVTVTEVAVKWVKKPAATSGDKLSTTISGSVDVASYVYCAVSKTGKRRMLNTTANATNKTTTTTTPAVKETVTLQSASTAAKYSIKRSEAKAAALSFSMKFDGLSDGKTYDWLCEATSLSPSAPSFRTTMEKGTFKTYLTPDPTVGDKTLWSSLFAAILMIAAVFFY